MYWSKDNHYHQPENLYEAQGRYSLVEDRYGEGLQNNLPAEDKEKWIAALLSGDYKQATNTLCRIDNKGEAEGHCCLGVKAELDNVPWHVDTNAKVFEFPAPWPGGTWPNAGSFPHEWAKTHGMANGKGGFDIEFELFGVKFFQRLSLAHLNDNGFTFPQIADIIRHFF